jgi:hypothetical protein
MEKKHFLLIILIVILVSAIFLRVKTRLSEQNALSKIEKSTVSSVAIIEDEVKKEVEVEEEMVKAPAKVNVLISTPQSGDLITSPLLVQGRISGTWFFEASLPIRLISADGEIIAEHYALADEEWMTVAPVEFSGVLEFSLEDVKVDNGYLLVIKDNPSGLPEHDGVIRMPVRFR